MAQIQQRGLPAYYVYQPFHAADLRGAEHIVRAFAENPGAPGSQGLAEAMFKPLDSMKNLSAENHAVLVIYGHGNLGKGIGTKADKLNANQLVDKLKEEGLQQKQKNLTIYLVACNSGSICLRNKESYAESFAKKLAKQKFCRIRVVGIAGFITEDGTISCLKWGNDETYDACEERSKTTWPIIEKKRVYITDKKRQVLFDVNDGKVTKSPNNSVWRLTKDGKYAGKDKYKAYKEGSEEFVEEDDDDEVDEHKQKMIANRQKLMEQHRKRLNKAKGNNQGNIYSIKDNRPRGRCNKMTTLQYQCMLRNRERVKEKYRDYIINEDGYNNLGCPGYKLRRFF